MKSINFGGQTWTTTGRKIKTGLDIVITLQQLIRWLKLLQGITGRGKRLFPGKNDPDAPISHTAINMALGLIGYKNKLVGHGASAIWFPVRRFRCFKCVTVLNRTSKPTRIAFIFYK